MYDENLCQILMRHFANFPPDSTLQPFIGVSYQTMASVDRFQVPLVPRVTFQRPLTPSVRKSSPYLHKTIMLVCEYIRITINVQRYSSLGIVSNALLHRSRK